MKTAVKLARQGQQGHSLGKGDKKRPSGHGQEREIKYEGKFISALASLGTN